MNAWWFSLLLVLASLAGLLNSRRTLRLYFVAQFVNALAVLVFAHWLTHWYLAAYIVTTVPIIECLMFLLWDAGITGLQFWISVNFGIFIGAVGAYSAQSWGPGTYTTFIEGVLLSMLGMALALTAEDKREWVEIRIIGALSLILSCYDFAFVRGWRETNSWLPSLMCSLAFIWVAFSNVSKAKPAAPYIA